MSSVPETAATPAAETAAAPTTDTTATTNAPTEECEYDYLEDLDLPPLRIHATRVRDRLSASSLNIPPGIQNQISQKRYSLDSKATTLATASPSAGSLASSIASRRGRSRSRSPSMRQKDRFDGNSSLSSLEEIDPDILYDKMGFGDDTSSIGKKQQGHNSYTFGDGSGTRLINLTPVSERMSEDTLEDVHAFSDLSANTNTRPSSSVGTGGSTVGGEVSSHVLERLDEGDEDLESEDDEKLADERHPSQVILTNLENITLHDDGLEEIEEEEGKA